MAVLSPPGARGSMKPKACAVCCQGFGLWWKISPQPKAAADRGASAVKAFAVSTSPKAWSFCAASAEFIAPRTGSSYQIAGIAPPNHNQLHILVERGPSERVRLGPGDWIVSDGRRPRARRRPLPEQVCYFPLLLLPGSPCWVGCCGVFSVLFCFAVLHSLQLQSAGCRQLPHRSEWWPLCPWQ